MSHQQQLTAADIAMLWEDGKRMMPHGQLDRYFFYDIPDLIRARQLGFYTPVDVIKAYQAGNTEDTHSINLARLDAVGQEWHAGNIAYHGVVLGHVAAKFAHTEMAAAAYTESIRKGEPNVQGMLDIPLKLCQPERAPWLNWRRDYVEPRSGNYPDSTSFLASQADWTRGSPAPACSILEPLKNYHTYVPYLKDSNKMNVISINRGPLRALDHILPRRISTRIIEDDYILAGWFLSDPRVRAEDILDRMNVPHSLQIQQFLRATIYQQVDKWCTTNNTFSVFTNSSLTADQNTVADLTDLQCKHNTTWELDVVSETVKCQGTEMWYSTSWLHPTSPVMQDYPADPALPYSPRVMRARYRPLDDGVTAGPAW